MRERGGKTTKKKWVIREPDRAAVAELRARGYSRVLSILLANRNIYGPQAESYFSGLCGFYDASLLDGVDAAAQRIQIAVENGEKIVVYGDYDVDGVTATALLVTFLKKKGADAGFYIPERESEGYGMNCGALKQLRDSGAQIVVTVDTGISALGEALYAKELGLDLVITDHHEPGTELPAAAALVDPKLPGCSYPFRELAGVGVAFKLICALEKDADPRLLFEEYGGLVCLGTVADVVPLTDENRVFVQRGLELLGRDAGCGIGALIEASGVGGKKLTSGLLGFTLAPRINACGRMGSADDAFALLTEKNPERAAALAESLNENNRLRRETEDGILKEAVEIINNDSCIADSPVLIVSGEGWHSGVIGIVASRLTEIYAKPSVVVSFEGDEGRASCRSIRGLNIHDALTSCAERLERFGGHELAAGFTIRRENYEKFCTELIRYARGFSPPALETVMDCVLTPEELTLHTAEETKKIEPCGCGNPSPLFMVAEAEISVVTPVGNGNHLRLTLMKGGSRFQAMLFFADRAGFDYQPGDLVDLAVGLDVNFFRGARSLTVIVREIRKALVIEKGEELYQAFVSSERCGPDIFGPRPERAEFAAVYKYLLAQENAEIRLDRACVAIRKSLPDFNYFKLRLILDVFSEMHLLRYSIQNGCAAFEINKTIKIDLTQSRLLEKLSLGKE